jgi:zinc protease
VGFLVICVYIVSENRYLLMLDRAQAPPIADIGNLTVPPYELHHLQNGTPLYVVNMGTQEVVKLEIVFHAGRPFEHRQLAARATLSMLKEGCAEYDAAAIAEQIDFYGATLQTPYSLDSSNIALYTLNKYFDRVLPVVAAMLSSPQFPQKELDQFKQRNLVDLQVELSKTDVVAYRNITELMFGPTHPYGYNSNAATYEALTREDLIRHFSTHYVVGNCVMFLSGKVEAGMIRQIDDLFSRAIPVGKSEPSLPVVENLAPRKCYFPHPDRIQSAIRIGRRLFNRTHADYAGMYVLNTILGGYFGSRLMTNIREKKGYTYNIYSSLDPMRFDGAFFISTETDTRFVKDTLRQIYRELDKLRTAPVGEDELEMVRNYLLGGFLNMLDGPFNVADIYKTIILEDLPADYFENVVNTVRHITATTLQDLAQRYLQPADLWVVSVGEERP